MSPSCRPSCCQDDVDFYSGPLLRRPWFHLGPILAQICLFLAVSSCPKTVYVTYVLACFRSRLDSCFSPSLFESMMPSWPHLGLTSRRLGPLPAPSSHHLGAKNVHFTVCSPFVLLTSILTAIFLLRWPKMMSTSLPELIFADLGHILELSSPGYASSPFLQPPPKSPETRGGGQSP